MTAWDGGCRVPFIARWPGKISGGRTSDEILSTMDLLPTFAAMGGASLPKVTLDVLKGNRRETLVTGLTDADHALYIEQQLERHLKIADLPVAGEYGR